MKCDKIAFMRCSARIISLLFLGVFLLFFIFEGGFDFNSNATLADAALLLFVPVVFAAGTIASFYNELRGGVMILLSVLGYNIVLSFISTGFELEFYSLLIPGILFIITSYLSKKKISGVG